MKLLDKGFKIIMLNMLKEMKQIYSEEELETLKKKKAEK